MLQRFSRQPGTKKAESLVEVIMAIFIVAVGSSVATSLIISALQSNEFSRDNLVALNLAVEGVEAMRAIRDANWLKFSYDKTNCWNMRPDTPPDKPCTDVSAKPIAQATGTTGYTVDLDMTANKYSWNLPSSSIGSVLDLETPGTGSDPYRLYYYDTDSSDGSTTRHDILASLSSSGGTSTRNDASPYYRMVQVRYPSGSPTDQEMDVISTVQWRSQGVTHQVVLTTKLTNYQKVKVKS